MNFKDKLKKIIIDIAATKVESSEISDSTILTNDLGFDSVQIISLIVALETQFDIEIEDDDLDVEKLTVFKNLSDMIAKKIQKSND